jgi:hypothetical protein
MAFRHEWVIPGKVFYGKYWGEVGNTDVAAITQDTSERLAAAVDRLHYIADSMNVTQMPKSLGAVRQIIDLVRSPKTGYYIVIGHPQMIVDFFITAIVTITKVRFFRASSYEDAIAFLKEVDQTLDWSQYMEPKREVEATIQQQTL